MGLSQPPAATNELGGMGQQMQTSQQPFVTDFGKASSEPFGGSSAPVVPASGSTVSVSDAFGGLGPSEDAPLPSLGAFGTEPPVVEAASDDEDDDDEDDDDEDDDFGDFEGAAGGVAKVQVPSVSASADPMSKLISLDGLSRNVPKKQGSMMNEPIQQSPAAVQFAKGMSLGQSMAMGQGLASAPMQVPKPAPKKTSPADSFAGIDGLQKSTTASSSPSINKLNTNLDTGFKTSVMSNGGSGNASVINNIFDPSHMAAANQRQQQMAASAQMGVTPQMRAAMQQQQQMQQQMMMMNNPQMMQQMTPQQQQQMMMMMMQQQQMMMGGGGASGGGAGMMGQGMQGSGGQMGGMPNAGMMGGNPMGGPGGWS